jgi:argininosuccinate lyase
MKARAEAGFTHATALAERMALDEGIPFREAHKRVGALVAAADREGGSDLGMDAGELVVKLAHGGGAAPANVEAALAFLRTRRRAHAHTLRSWRARWRNAGRGLDEATRALA